MVATDTSPLAIVVVQDNVNVVFVVFVFAAVLAYADVENAPTLAKDTSKQRDLTAIARRSVPRFDGSFSPPSSRPGSDVENPRSPLDCIQIASRKPT